MLGLEGVVKRRRHAAGKEEFRGEFHGDGSGAIGPTLRGEDAAGDALGHLVTERPKAHADGVPAEIAEAALRFQVAAHADVPGEEIGRRVEAKLGVKAAQGAEFSGVEDLADGLEPLGVHEHDAVHELHVGLAACVDHLGQILGGEGARLFAKDVFAGLGGADDPFLAKAGGKRDVDRLDRGIREQFLVGAVGARRGGEGGFALAIRDKGGGLGLIPAGHGGHFARAGEEEGLPILASDAGSAEESPADRSRGHTTGGVEI